MVTTGQPVSERSAWIRRGWEDGRKGHRRQQADVPASWWEAYMVGWRRGNQG